MQEPGRARRLAKLLAVVVLCLASFAVGYAVQEVRARAYRQKVAEAGFSNAFGSPSHLPWLLSEGVAHFREELVDRYRDDCARALSTPWPSGESDRPWGVAYALVHHPPPEAWDHRPGMTRRQEDEMIRYLCFRVCVDTRSGSGACARALAALQTYPPEPLDRNRYRIVYMLKKTWTSPHVPVTRGAHRFLCRQVSRPWARKLAWYYWRRFNHFQRGFGRAWWDFRDFVVSLRQAGEAGDPAAAELNDQIRRTERYQALASGMERLARGLDRPEDPPTTAPAGPPDTGPGADPNAPGGPR